MTGTEGGKGVHIDADMVGSPPPEACQLVETWVLDSTQELSALRKGILGQLSAAAGTTLVELDGVADAMVLIATELTTNALKFGLPPTVVRLFHGNDVFLLDVADHDPITAPYIAGPRPPGDGGLGLQIARRLALNVGWYTSDGSKHVWAVLPDRPAAM